MIRWKWQKRTNSKVQTNWSFSTSPHPVMSGQPCDVVERTVATCFMPVTVGGGIRKLEDIRSMLLAGADKVSMNTAAILNPSLIDDATSTFGNQCIVVAIDAKKEPMVRAGLSTHMVVVNRLN